MKKGAFIGTLLGATVGVVASGKYMDRKVVEKEKKIDKFKSYYNMLNQWLALKQEGKSLDIYFKENAYKTVAIYGMGEMGNRLYDELKNTDIEVKYAIDKNAETVYSELDVKGLDDELPEVDVVVVTATFAFDKIEKELSRKGHWPIISLEDIVYDC